MTPVVNSNEQYLQMEKLLIQVCLIFHRRYGCDWDDLKSAANESYMRAVLSYDPSKGKLSTWVYRKAWLGLLEHWRNEVKYRRPFALHVRQEVFDVNELLREVSSDAAVMIRKCITAPRKVNRNTLRRFLVKSLADLGWCGSRIMTTFYEVKEALE